MADVLKENDDTQQDEFVIVEQDPAKKAEGTADGAQDDKALKHDPDADEDARIAAEDDKAAKDDKEREAIRERRRLEKLERKERKETAMKRDTIEMNFLRKRN